MPAERYIIGIDYGTDSVRAIIVDARNGTEMHSAVHNYTRWQEGKYCDPAQNMFRQHPLDYLEGLEKAVSAAVKAAGPGIADNIKGLAIDTTGSTICAVNKEGIPLALTEEFRENPDAMFVLWKDHTAVGEAGEINKLAKNWGGEDYTKYEGGIYSSEWFWAKILHVLRTDKKMQKAAFSWVEQCDWLPAVLTGNTAPQQLIRSRCAAGHKAMWHPDWGGLPAEEFLTKLDPLLAGLRDRLFKDTYTGDTKVGTLTAEWAQKLGLNEDVAVNVGVFDAHAGAVGSQIKAYSLSKVMGTSTCDMLVAPLADTEGKLVKGICGQVDGSIIPGMLGMEAGQSAFGDIYAWFKNLLLWPLQNITRVSKITDKKTMDKLLEETADKIIPLLSEKAAELPVAENAVTALDWMNGRRTPFANQLLKGAISNLNLGSDAPRIFKALVEATAFGARKISDRFKEEGIPIKEVIALGGIAKKSDYVMQVTADVMNMSIKVAASDQACALGAAMLGATAAGIYSSVEQAQQKMGSGFVKEYHPDPDRAAQYEKLYSRYSELGEFIENSLLKNN
ncbi:MAG TPA: ribulokinase [Spirochaetota bacterium]|nr:ribulokinase [Spirochaetota bacterium]